MRLVLLIIALLATGAEAQRKFGKVYSREDLIALQAKILRTQFPETIADDYLHFFPERTKLFIRFDSLQMVTMHDGSQRREKRLTDIHLKLNDITRYAAPFWIYFSYDVSLPEFPDAKIPASINVEFHGDTFTVQHSYDLGIPYSRITGKYRKAIRISSARPAASAAAEDLMLKTFGDRAFRNSFSQWKQPNHPTERIRPDGAFFPTSDGDSVFVPYEYSFYYAAHPIDLPQTARDFVVTFDAELQQKDTAFFNEQLRWLPDCIRTGDPSGAMSEQEAIAQAIAAGMPPAKKSYRNNIYQNRMDYVWSIFSIQRSTHSVDKIGHPCDMYYGVSLTLNAVTGEILSGPMENSMMEGCYD